MCSRFWDSAAYSYIGILAAVSALLCILLVCAEAAAKRQLLRYPCLLLVYSFFVSCGWSENCRIQRLPEVPVVPLFHKKMRINTTSRTVVRSGGGLLYLRGRASLSGLLSAANHPERIVVKALQAVDVQALSAEEWTVHFHRICGKRCRRGVS